MWGEGEGVREEPGSKVGEEATVFCCLLCPGTVIVLGSIGAGTC